MKWNLNINHHRDDSSASGGCFDWFCVCLERKPHLPLKPIQFRLTPVRNNANWCTFREPLFRVQLESITIGGHIKNRPGFLSLRKPHIPLSSANFRSWTQLSHRVFLPSIRNNRNINSANRLPFINRSSSEAQSWLIETVKFYWLVWPFSAGLFRQQRRLLAVALNFY